MNNIRGNLFKYTCDAIAITTNGFIKKSGECVMGRGCAKQATHLIPRLPIIVGNAIKKNGNKTQIVYQSNDILLLIFPVKPISIPFQHDGQVVSHMQKKFKLNALIPGWACIADLAIIKQSARELVQLTNKHGWKNIIIPRPGCGAGELSWNTVEPILQSILDDRFSAITF